MSLLPQLTYEIDINEPLRTTEFTAVEGSDFEIIVRVKRCGVIQTVEGVTPSLILANSAGDWVRTFTGTAGGANDESLTIPVAGTSLDSSGTMDYDIKLTDADGNTPIWRRGKFVLYAAVPDSVTPPAGNPIDWSDYSSYSNTATDGPYTAGTGIAFGTADANGRLPIQFDGAPGSDITFDNTTSELTATDVQAAIDELDGIVDQLSGTITITVRNSTGVQIDKGAVVYINGATGNRATVALADADIANTATKTIGLAFANIPHNSDGEIVVLGEITGVNTIDFEDGDQVWLSQTPGQPTNIRPTDDAAYAYRVGYVEVAGNNGKILVAPQFEGTVYGETFFAATSAAGVRTEIDARKNFQFKGAWDATTNNPTLTDGTGTQGDMYYVAGKQGFSASVDTGSGAQTYTGRNYIWYDGGVWKPLANADVPWRDLRARTFEVLDSSEVRAFSDAPNTYPAGVIYYGHASATSDGWPYDEINTVTIGNASSRSSQLMYDRDTNDIYVRQAVDPDTWGSFEKVHLDQQDVNTAIVKALTASGIALKDSTGTTQATIDSTGLALTTDLALTEGGTGASTAQGAVYNLSATRVATMTGDETLTASSAPVQFLDPADSDRNLDLPNGTQFTVQNTGDGGELLTVRDSGDVTIDTVENGVTLTFIDATGSGGWEVMT